jgi:hypothetical protein
MSSKSKLDVGSSNSYSFTGPNANKFIYFPKRGGHNGRMVLPMQSVPIATNVVSLNPTHGEVYWIQHYVIKFVY